LTSLTLLDTVANFKQNPVCMQQDFDYCEYVFKTLPQLQRLDDRDRLGTCLSMDSLLLDDKENDFVDLPPSLSSSISSFAPHLVNGVKPATKDSAANSKKTKVAHTEVRDIAISTEPEPENVDSGKAPVGSEKEMHQQQRIEQLEATIANFIAEKQTQEAVKEATERAEEWKKKSFQLEEQLATMTKQLKESQQEYVTAKDHLVQLQQKTTHQDAMVSPINLGIH